jgi:hypothetical protein
VQHNSHHIDALELPVHSKYILIAAYLASYNPSATDVKFFSKVPMCLCEIVVLVDVWRSQIKKAYHQHERFAHTNDAFQVFFKQK